MGKKLGVKDYHDAQVQAAFSDAEVERAIKEGVKTNGKETMKPFGTSFPALTSRHWLHTFAHLKNKHLNSATSVLECAMNRFCTAAEMATLFVNRDLLSCLKVTFEPSCK